MSITVQFTPPYTVEDIEFGHRLLDQAATLLDSEGTDETLRLQIRQSAAGSQGALLLRKVAEFTLEHGRAPDGPEIQRAVGRSVSGMMMSLNTFFKKSTGLPGLLRNEYHADTATPKYVMEHRVAKAVLQVIDADGNLG
jgi:hypothetical protein